MIGRRFREQSAIQKDQGTNRGKGSRPGRAGDGQMTIRLSVRSDANPDIARAHATDVVHSALSAVGADVSISTELVDAIERAGTGAKEKLVALS
jgi:hypothetical protein